MAGSKGRAGGLLLLTFIAGAAAGVAAERLGALPGGVASGAARAVEGNRGGGRREGRQTTIERFADELELTGDQRQEIEDILEHYRAAMHGLWTDVRPRYRALVDSVRGRIEEVLTPEQVTEYRALLEQRYRDEERRRPEKGSR
ncbi:MAG: hypothetical protein ACE5HQ_01105 [Gemmatimonadota bacterium]